MPLRTASTHSVVSGPSTWPDFADTWTAHSEYPASASTDTGATG